MTKKLTKTIKQNLIPDDEATTNQDNIDRVLSNRFPEFKVWEGEDKEENESSNKDSIISTNTKTLNFDPFQTKVEGQLESHNDTATQTLKLISQQILITTIIKFLQMKKLKKQTLKLQQ